MDDNNAHGFEDCECFHSCGDCSLSGDWHQHPEYPCPVHPDAPGDLPIERQDPALRAAIDEAWRREQRERRHAERMTRPLDSP